MLSYLTTTVNRKVCPADFFPMLEVLEGAIKSKGKLNTTARVFVDGIDRQKASELTNALRVRGASLERVRSRRDESEPMIRLADMWAGCIRAARGGSQEEAKMLDAAEQENSTFGGLHFNSQRSMKEVC